MSANEPSEFNEASFAFAFAHQLANLWQEILLAAPLPTPREEGHEGGGWDQKFECEGFVYFVQYKLSEYCRHGGTRGAATLGCPFYRFELRTGPTINQHRQLMDLAATGSIVEYVAPRFHRAGEFQTHFANGSVPTAVRRVRPADIGAIADNESHFVAFKLDGSSPTLFSDPVPLPDGNYRPYTNDGFAASLQADGLAGADDRATSVRDQIVAALIVLENAAAEGGLLTSAAVEPLPPPDRLIVLAKAVLGADVFIARHS